VEGCRAEEGLPHPALARSWASGEGREFVKQKLAVTGKKGGAPRGSQPVSRLNKAASIQIALRLAEPDVAKARELAMRKGIGYQTLLKMLVHEGALPRSAPGVKGSERPATGTRLRR
jgi:hypothetical protein